MLSIESTDLKRRELTLVIVAVNKVLTGVARSAELLSGRGKNLIN